MGAVGAQVGTEISKSGTNIWDENIRFNDAAVSIVFLERCRMKLRHPGFHNPAWDGESLGGK